MSRLSYNDVVEMLKEAISSKNKSINLEVEAISRCAYADSIVDRSKYLSKTIIARDTLVAFLQDLQDKEKRL